MHLELKLRSDYLENELVETIYFGGGTPSLLSGDELKIVLEQIHARHEVSATAEVTLEANPDDLDLPKLRELKSTGINRLSIGVQSFNDADLRLMNRSHTATQADYAVKCAQDCGFTNLSIDLIYSIPGMNTTSWRENLQKAIALDVPHLSAYCLTFEERTPFGRWLAEGKISAPPDDVASKQFLLMIEMLASDGFMHYEVSNFCKEGMQSRHNTSYWQDKKYLGIGPSAHSYNGHSRQWNVANNSRYISSVMNGEPDCSIEIIDDRTKLNEYLMTRLRTQWGIDYAEAKTKFGIQIDSMYADEIHDLKSRGEAVEENGTLRLTAIGMLRADRIASDFFILES